MAGPCTRVAVHLRENQHGRPHRDAQFHGNVVEFGNAPEGAEIGRFTGGEVTFERNAWSRVPPANMRGAGDVAGPLGLVNPGAAIGVGFDLDNYRPRAGGPLDGAGIGALAVEGPEPPPDPPDGPEPPLEAPDWDALIEQAAAVGAQLAVQAEANRGRWALLEELREAEAVFSLALDQATAELGELLLKLDEYKQAAG